MNERWTEKLPERDREEQSACLSNVCTELLNLDLVISVLGNGECVMIHIRSTFCVFIERKTGSHIKRLS